MEVCIKEVTGNSVVLSFVDIGVLDVDNGIFSGSSMVDVIGDFVFTAIWNCVVDVGILIRSCVVEVIGNVVVIVIIGNFVFDACICVFVFSCVGDAVFGAWTVVVRIFGFVGICVMIVIGNAVDIVAFGSCIVDVVGIFVTDDIWKLVVINCVLGVNGNFVAWSFVKISVINVAACISVGSCVNDTVVGKWIGDVGIWILVSCCREGASDNRLLDVDLWIPVRYCVLEAFGNSVDLIVVCSCMVDVCIWEFVVGTCKVDVIGNSMAIFDFGCCVFDIVGICGLIIIVISVVAFSRNFLLDIIGNSLVKVVIGIFVVDAAIDTCVIDIGTWVLGYCVVDRIIGICAVDLPNGKGVVDIIGNSVVIVVISSEFIIVVCDFAIVVLSNCDVVCLFVVGVTGDHIMGVVGWCILIIVEGIFIVDVFGNSVYVVVSNSVAGSIVVDIIGNIVVAGIWVFCVNLWNSVADVVVWSWEFGSDGNCIVGIVDCNTVIVVESLPENTFVKKCLDDVFIIIVAGNCVDVGTSGVNVDFGNMVLVITGVFDIGTCVTEVLVGNFLSDIGNSLVSSLMVGIWIALVVIVDSGGIVLGKFDFIFDITNFVGFCITVGITTVGSRFVGDSCVFNIVGIFAFSVVIGKCLIGVLGNGVVDILGKCVFDFVCNCNVNVVDESGIFVVTVINDAVGFADKIFLAFTVEDFGLIVVGNGVPIIDNVLVIGQVVVLIIGGKDIFVFFEGRNEPIPFFNKLVVVIIGSNAVGDFLNASIGVFVDGDGILLVTKCNGEVEVIIDNFGIVGNVRVIENMLFDIFDGKIVFEVIVCKNVSVLVWANNGILDILFSKIWVFTGNKDLTDSVYCLLVFNGAGVVFVINTAGDVMALNEVILGRVGVIVDDRKGLVGNGFTETFIGIVDLVLMIGAETCLLFGIVEDFVITSFGNVLDIVAGNVFLLIAVCKILLLFVFGSIVLLLFLKDNVVPSAADDTVVLVLPNGFISASMEEIIMFITAGNVVTLGFDINFPALIVFDSMVLILFISTELVMVKNVLVLGIVGNIEIVFTSVFFFLKGNFGRFLFVFAILLLVIGSILVLRVEDSSEWFSIIVALDIFLSLFEEDLEMPSIGGIENREGNLVADLKTVSFSSIYIVGTGEFLLLILVGNIVALGGPEVSIGLRLLCWVVLYDVEVIFDTNVIILLNFVTTVGFSHVVPIVGIYAMILFLVLLTGVCSLVLIVGVVLLTDINLGPLVVDIWLYIICDALLIVKLVLDLGPYTLVIVVNNDILEPLIGDISDVKRFVILGDELGDFTEPVIEIDFDEGK